MAEWTRREQLEQGLTRYRFGLYEFDRQNLELRRDGVKVALEAQPAKALGLLLSRGGEVTTRDELKALLWGDGTNVDFDRGIAYCLSAIRSALQDNGANPRFVQTIPKQGFRMLAPVLVVGEKSRREVLWAGYAAAAGVLAVGGWYLFPKRASIGVSIFDNETGRTDLDRWVAGLSDLVVARLSTLDVGIVGNAAALRRPRNIRQLQTLAKEVDVDYVLLGQLQVQEPKLRFVTHLIRLSDEVHLKANRIVWEGQDMAGLEALVLAEFERAVKEHVLHSPDTRGEVIVKKELSA